MHEDLGGWWHAPAGGGWRCPDCQVLSPIETWTASEVGCELCGAHDARVCPVCGTFFDHVWGSKAIATATAPSRLP
jgi:hypothetical protein